jgi:segregation and condensation protein B
MTQTRSTEILEALLLSSDRPLSAARLASVVPRVSEREIENLVGELNAGYEASGRAFRARLVAGGYRLFTEPEFDAYVEALAVTSREARLSQAALETLAVVAYRQPVSKNDVEFVRGCDCDGVLRTLLSRRLVAIKGRSDAPGRPLLYATTDRFLEYFGLAGIGDLPDWSEIAALVGDGTPQAKLTLVRGPEGNTESEPEASVDSELLLTVEQELPADASLPGATDSTREPAEVVQEPAEFAAISPGEDAT